MRDSVALVAHVVEKGVGSLRLQACDRKHRMVLLAEHTHAQVCLYLLCFARQVEHDLPQRIPVVVLEEHLCFPDLPPRELRLLEDFLNVRTVRLDVVLVLKPNNRVPRHEIRKTDAKRVALTANADRLKHSRVLELVDNVLIVPVARLVDTVRLDAPHEMRLARRHFSYEELQGERKGG